jgi:hypothetical protein
MTSRVKHSLLAVVVAVLLLLLLQLRIGPLLLPGLMVVRAFVPLPDPYPLASSTHPPAFLAVLMVSYVFWFSILIAWLAIGHARAASSTFKRRANESQ